MTTLWIAAAAAFIAHMHVSTNPTMSKGAQWAVIVLVAVGVVALMLTPILLTR